MLYGDGLYRIIIHTAADLPFHQLPPPGKRYRLMTGLPRPGKG